MYDAGGKRGETVAGSGGASRYAADVAPTRYRCDACGNLTRFDVIATRRTRAFHHFGLGGELQVEDVEVLSETIEAVVCRWCASGAAVAALPDEPVVEAVSAP
jgi:hypothetical protein